MPQMNMLKIVVLNSQNKNGKIEWLRYIDMNHHTLIILPEGYRYDDFQDMIRTGKSDINRIFTDADAYVGHALSTKNDMVKWIKYVKSENSSLIKLPEGYEIIELNKLLSNHRSAIRVNELPAIIAHIRGQV